MTRRLLALAALAVCLCAACCLLAAPAQPAYAVGEAAQPGAPAPANTSAQAAPAKKHVYTWVKKGGYYYCKRDGKKLKGLNAVKGKTYYFDKKGRQRTSWRKVGTSYRFFTPANGKAGFMVVSKVVNGIKLKKDGTARYGSVGKKELAIMVKASAFVDARTKPAQTRSVKLRKCFSYLIYTCGLAVYRSFNSHGWHRPFALDIFDKHKGDCTSFGAAYAYIANAIGVKRAYAVASGGHGWTEVDGKVCDGQWAHGGRWRYYMFPMGQSGHAGAPAYASNRSYVVKIQPRTKPWDAVSGSASKAKAASGKNGIVKRGSSYYLYRDGKKLKSRWATWKKRRYYLTSSGRAAVKSVKLRPDGKKGAKKRYFVFSAKGVLQTGSKTRVVSVGGVKYRVAKSGAAKPGWQGSKRYFLADGQLACGTRLVGGKLYAFGRAGSRDVALTEKLQAAHARAKAKAAYAGELVSLLGTPKSTWSGATCFEMTDPKTGTAYDQSNAQDVIYTYDHIVVSTMRSNADAAVELLEGIQTR